MSTPMTLFGRIPVPSGEKPRKTRPHTAHKLHVISECPDCGAALLLGCEWKNSRGTGFCTFTEKISKRHVCSIVAVF